MKNEWSHGTVRRAASQDFVAVKISGLGRKVSIIAGGGDWVSFRNSLGEIFALEFLTIHT